ncbi:MAG: hypothetical protein JXB88_11450 [Spirochaetales bacterium]|nr:hypothetical protein [Spirochaetales bacterium]
MKDHIKEITEKLKGWKDPMTAMRDNHSIKIEGFGDLTMDYYNKNNIRISLEIHIEKEHIRAHIINKEETEGITFIVKFSIDDITGLLDIFVKHQDTVNLENLSGILDEIIKSDLADKVFVETPDGLIEVTE